MASCNQPVTSAEAEGLSEDAVLDLILCRLGELKRAGCDSLACVVLAGRADVDLDRATELIGRGCSPELALRILV